MSMWWPCATSATSPPALAGNALVRQALGAAMREARRFDDQDLADLGNLLTLLRPAAVRLPGTSLPALTEALEARLAPGAAGLILASCAHDGDDAERINGASIYWPRELRSLTYDDLAFAATGWGALIDHVLATA